jgi:hypothetical protein
MVATLLSSPLLYVGIPILLLAFFGAQLIHLVLIMAWCDGQTRGVRYYGLSLRQRSRFRTILGLHRVALTPILWLLARCRRPSFVEGSFRFRGISGPKGTCSLEDFRRAAEYRPSSDDVFVATQMKCGTTWMQHLVIQVLARGNHNLAEDGKTLYAVSPWLESSKTVSPETAPLVGSERPSRIIKTHFPASLCPYSPDTKYIYVARHPVSCFASCVDFVQSNLQEFAPSLESCETWYRSEQLMWWGTWPAHVAGWYELAQQNQNVLFIRFQDLKRDLAGATRQVANFLEVADLSDQEMANIIRKCSFEYMRNHVDSFEMHPPHILQSSGKFFVSGRINRYRDIPPAMANRISEWSRDGLTARGIPWKKLFPDLGENPAAAA